MAAAGDRVFVRKASGLIKTASNADVLIFERERALPNHQVEPERRLVGGVDLAVVVARTAEVERCADQRVEHQRVVGAIDECRWQAQLEHVVDELHGAGATISLRVDSRHRAA